MDLIWLIPILPGVGAAINGLIGIRSFSRRTSGVLACAAMAGPLLAERAHAAGQGDEIRIGNTMPYSGPAAAYGVPPSQTLRSR